MLHFYQDVIGLQRIADPFKDDVHAWFEIGHKTELHIIGGAKKVNKQALGQHMSFSVPSVDAFIERLVKAKIPYINSRGKKNAITSRPDGVKQIYFKDPDGYWIEMNDAR